MIPGLGRPITATSEIEELKRDPANKGKTFEVTREVLEHYVNQLQRRRIEPSELEELNALLESNIGPNDRPALSRTCACPSCGHEFSFSDFVRSAIALSVHTKDQVLDFLVGSRYYLTIDSEATRTLQCPSCARSFEGVFCCYSTSNYAYA